MHGGRASTRTFTARCQELSSRQPTSFQSCRLRDPGLASWHRALKSWVPLPASWKGKHQKFHDPVPRTELTAAFIVPELPRRHEVRDPGPMSWHQALKFWVHFSAQWRGQHQKFHDPVPRTELTAAYIVPELPHQRPWPHILAPDPEILGAPSCIMERPAPEVSRPGAKN